MQVEIESATAAYRAAAAPAAPVLLAEGRPALVEAALAAAVLAAHQVCAVLVVVVVGVAGKNKIKKGQVP